MIVGVLKEPAFESRVSLLAESVTALVKKKIEVWIEAGAGVKAYCGDDDYIKAGAVLRSREELLAGADILLSIHYNDIPATFGHKILIGVYQPLFNHAHLPVWAKQHITSFSLDMLPRTTRAQSMDVLSSQANIAGYKAILLAAEKSPRYFPMLMTAAGSIAPAKVLILGAGVAGLQAIATARRLGAVVEVFDTRPAVKEEVMSLGGKFIEVPGAADASKAGGYAVEQSADFQLRQQEKIAESIARADVVITTAQIPGKRAPVLVTSSMIGAMRKGSVIIDLAAATGGNTDVTKNNETVVYHGVTIVGDSSLPSSMPYDASKLYGKNVLNFLQLITGKEGQLNLDFSDDLVKGCCITYNGEVVHEKLRAVSDKP
ncbi:NAD(P) transhydrogenase subunit alpha [Flavitalea sp. BT771]|uniref:NAD(P) transhydrogenase subunit alpha n=1 Tax=Flavitalea sp. BT771 TaxID=3063329 RepID=UPI0026E254F9|nr:NAD(P) transhydrogenase subunit alpha [Flavitalea sp. BT771]MDO6429844.1 NAD(P) transhydrogenase subunit alpha [Flavitalea sp. BT771]MDV6218028.1 NAD(P) transhydrogenase subunit alpha [Flavitalea sp. BT771]